MRPDAVLGLDVSTSCVGVCVLPVEKEVDRRLDRMDFKGCDGFWRKAEFARDYLRELRDDSRWKISAVSIEEPLLGFAGGKSSAKTITSLVRFNGIVSYLCLETFGIDPTYVNVNSARKSCGIKLTPRKVGGPQKEQVFKHMSERDLKDVVWPTKKSGKIVDWAGDATDAYVIAKSYLLGMK